MKKAPFEEVLAAFDAVWEKHSKFYDNRDLMKDWNKTVKSMGWTDEEFDLELHKRGLDDLVTVENTKEKAA